jgi:AGZA family xanthine/uracil permease-like MFS transporter
MSQQDEPRAAGPRLLDELYAGMALFFAMYYILSVNPAILEQAGMPRSATLFGTIVAIVLGNLTGVLTTRTGLMIAPAVGISSFFATYVQNVRPPEMFDWRDAMAGCVIAGVALTLTSFYTNLRSRIIEDLPKPVRKGASAAIGSLLVKKAFDLYTDSVNRGLDPKFGVVFMGLGTAVIIAFFLLRSRYPRHHLGQLVLRSEFVIVVGLVVWALHVWQPHYLASLQTHTTLSFLWSDPGVWSQWTLDGHVLPTCALMIVFAAIIWFIVVSDIPGTPNEVLPDRIKNTDGARAVEGGFKNDGIWALISPLVGTTPTIYYAENNILRDFDVYSMRVGICTIVLFVAVIALTYGFGISLEQLIPPFATIPIVLFIGIFIISVAFMRRPDEAESTIKHGYYIPTAIAVILTPRLGIEYAFPLSAMSYWLVRDKTDPGGPTFVWISIGACVSLGLFFLVYLQS